MTFYNATPFQGLGIPITGTLNGYDQYFHAAGITVYSTNNYGLIADGLDNRITIEGTLIGTVGMEVGFSSAGFGNRVVIGATGVVIGTTSAALAILGGQTTINNAGVISGINGVIFGSDLGTGSMLVNSGRILANGYAVFVTGDEKVSLLNTGTITSYNSRSFDGDAGADAVTNQGTMNGNVDLFSNNDRYDGTGGRVNGIVYGAAGNDVLIGGSVVDKLDGGANSDFLYGRGGRDALTGGLNADRFYFDTAPSTTLNRDTITDFSAVDDTIYLKKAVFAAITQAAGVLQGQFYWEAANGLAHDPTDRIILNTSNGVLSYDSNGNAAGGVQQIAVLLMVANTPSNLDFFVY